MSRFLRENYQTLAAYVPGEQPTDMGYVKLNTNESPYPPCAEVIRAAAEAARSLELYPDPVCAGLRDSIAEQCGVARENVCPVNGSDDALKMAFMAFGGGGCAFPDVTYGFYTVFCDLLGLPYRQIPLETDFTVDPAKYFGANAMVVLANPNAPTGVALPVARIEEILRANPDRVVLVDEAYVDFGGESCLPLAPKYENLLVVQTFSKSRSMAGARLGFAVGQRPLIDDLEKIRYSTNPYNINRMTMAAGIAALESGGYYADACRKIVETREWFAAEIGNLGFEALPSSANFVFARHPQVSGEAVYEGLKRRGVLVRHFQAPRIRDFNRITIGTREQMEILLRAAGEIIREAK